MCVCERERERERRGGQAVCVCVCVCVCVSLSAFKHGIFRPMADLSGDLPPDSKETEESAHHDVIADLMS